MRLNNAGQIRWRRGQNLARVLDRNSFIQICRQLIGYLYLEDVLAVALNPLAGFVGVKQLRQSAQRLPRVKARPWFALN
jgi:hypothetical protein